MSSGQTSALMKFGSSEDLAAALRQGGICGLDIPEQSWLQSSASNGAEMLARLEPTISTEAAQCRFRKVQLFEGLSGCQREWQGGLGSLAAKSYGILANPGRSRTHHRFLL